MATWDLRRLQQDLDRSTPSALYLFFGEEAYLVDQAVQAIKSKILQEGLKDFNYDSFHASEVKASQVRDAVETLPMMADRRLIILRGAHSLKEKDWETLAPCLDEPIESSTLVLVADKIDKRKKAYKKLMKNAICVELKRPYDNQIPVWVEYIAYQNDVKITPEASRLLQQMVGASLSEINNEVFKLKQFLGDKDQADVDDVLKVVSRARVDSVFDLADAIGRKDRATALTCLANLLEHGQSEVATLSLVLRHVRILSSVREGLQQGLSGQRLSAKVGVPGFFLKQYMNQSRYWDERKIHQTIDALHETDRAIKSSPVSSHIWLENFIVQTC